MTQSVKTLVFASVALLALGIGYATHRSYKPSDLEGFSDVGTEFFPDFDDPNSVTGLRVASFNKDTGKTELFSVEQKDGLWRIPSHHNYPADGEEQLARTAASMIGVERQALVERTKAAHKRHNLLDPLDQSDAASEGFGDRITLSKGDEVLADFIVGSPVEGQEHVYFVRAADEDRFYTANLGEFEISTKFSDWILKDILDINRNNITELIIDRYQVDEARGVVVKGDKMTLTRENSQAEWALDGIDATTEKVNASNINAMLLALDDLAIVGVRRKPDGISADLKAEEGVSITTFDMLDLQDKGFFIDQRQGRILSNEGEVLVGTNEGVLYALRFGEEFSGSDVEIEVGQKKSDDDTPKATDDKKSDDDTETKSSPEVDPEGSLQQSRYLFITAQFDAELLGPKPIAPVKPEPPETPKAEDAEKSDTPAEDAAQPEQADATAETADAETPDPQKEYEAALARYEEEQEVYEFQLKDYEAKIKKGTERVAELNRRFADWYYVISSDIFERMKLNRVDIVQPQETSAEENGPELPGTPESAHPISEEPAAPSTEMKDAAPVDSPAEPGKAETPASEPAATEEPAKPASEPKETTTPESPPKETTATESAEKTADAPKAETPSDPKPVDSPAEPVTGNEPATPGE